MNNDKSGSKSVFTELKYYTIFRYYLLTFVSVLINTCSKPYFLPCSNALHVQVFSIFQGKLVHQHMSCKIPHPLPYWQTNKQEKELKYTTISGWKPFWKLLVQWVNACVVVAGYSLTWTNHRAVLQQGSFFRIFSHSGTCKFIRGIFWLLSTSLLSPL